MSTLLQIAQLGNPVLRKKARAVTNIKTKNIQTLIDNLISTVVDVDGVGIAAPQVYESVRVFIMASHPNARYPHAPHMPPTAIINPEVVSHSKETVKDWEGCLSIPGVRALVPRYKSVKVKYLTRDGKTITTKYTNFLARIFQHELDHLDGIVFYDRLETPRDIVTEKEYQKFIASREKKRKK